MSKPRHPNVVNVSDLEPRSGEKGTRFAYHARHLGHATGGRGIGCSWYEVPPGKTAYPYHFHTANEESVYVLEGTGIMRIGAEEVPVGPGDYITFPIGPDHAHQLVNSGEAPLRYLCFSTLIPVEVVGYPDSKKIGAMAWKSDNSGPALRILVKEDSAVSDYYDGERID